MAFKVKQITYVPIDVERDKLMTLMEVSGVLGLTLPGVIAAIQRGTFTEIIDDEAVNPQHERRLLLRSEVEDEARRRGIQFEMEG